jgi:hypothetical protein
LGSGDQTLFMVNMGGCVAGHFGEVHEYGLVVAKSLTQAKQLARQQLLTSAQDQHIDYAFAINDKLKSSDGLKYYLNLVACDQVVINEYQSRYIVLKPKETDND